MFCSQVDHMHPHTSYAKVEFALMLYCGIAVLLYCVIAILRCDPECLFKSFVTHRKMSELKIV